jgi:REP element-mobilizing transposase RayT
MGRSPRSNLPGVAFHLTARLHGREPLFVGIEMRVADIITESMALGGMNLLAYAVMPNHLHIVAVQGNLPLSRSMQPLLRRLAGVIARSRNRAGHVFERRFADRPCLDPVYLRNAIAYVHLNPVRAGLCARADEYPWTSHLAYATAAAATARTPAGTELGLRLFAETERCSTGACRASYMRFVAWRRCMDEYLARPDDEAGSDMPAQPCCDGGDRSWIDCFDYAVAEARQYLTEQAMLRTRPDLAAVVRTALAAEDDALHDLRWLRSGARTAALVRVRRLVVERCLAAGYTNAQVARYLNVSHSTISIVAAARRRAFLEARIGQSASHPGLS